MTNPVNIELKDQADQNAKEVLPNMIRTVSVNIGGRDIPLRYDMRAQMQIEEDLDMDCNELMDRLKQRKKTSRLVMGAIRVLGNEGLRHAGQDADLTAEWLEEHITPARVNLYRVALQAAITASWFMETEDTEKERDETLEEIRKKKENTA